MNTVLACQNQYFAGGQSYDSPYFQTSPASVDVSKDTWVSFWDSGLPDNRSSNQDPIAHDQLFNVVQSLQDANSWGNQLSSQMFTNKQLHDTLKQKEDELARLHEENNKLKQYMNSNFVKSLEEKTKKLMSPNILIPFGAPQKRKMKTKRSSSPENSFKRARRNLFNEFTACEEKSSPTVDNWVLQTLGLKDVNTIDDSTSPNYQSAPSDLTCKLLAADYCSIKDSPPPSVYNNVHTTPVHNQDAISSNQSSVHDSIAILCNLTPPASLKSSCSLTPPHSHNSSPSYETPIHNQSPPHSNSANSNSQYSTFFQSYSPSQCSSVSPRSESASPLTNVTYYPPNISLNNTMVAFSTALKPHHNVKTHTFNHGQAFVRRDEGGWKFTWMPKTSE